MCYLTGVSEDQEARSSLAEKASQSQLGMQRSEGCQYRRIHLQEDLLTWLLAGGLGQSLDSGRRPRFLIHMTSVQDVSMNFTQSEQSNRKRGVTVPCVA